MYLFVTSRVGNKVNNKGDNWYPLENGISFDSWQLFYKDLIDAKGGATD